MQHNVQQQLLDELSQLRNTLECNAAAPPRNSPAAKTGRPRSALDLARAKPTRNRRIEPVREVQGTLPLLDD